jgi:SAM-dependent methyltransferase
MSEPKGYVPPEYLEKVGQLLLPFKERTYALMQVQAGHRVLDVGCGNGIDTVALAGLVGSGGRVVGMDYDAAMLAAGESRAKQADVSERITYRQCDAASLPFENDTFDSCRSERVFQHLLNPDATLAEMVRVTKSGGWIVVMDPDWATLSINSAEIDLERRLMRYKAEHEQHHGFSGRELLGMFKHHGLADISVESGTLQMEDVTVGRFVVGMDKLEANALSSDVITADELARWRASLEQAAADGSFFAIMSGITVAGRKP